MSVSIRDRLLGRSRPSLVVSIRVDDTTAAERDLLAARAALRQAQVRGDDDVDDLQAQVDAAQAGVDAGYVEFTVRALAPADLEALIAAHPPTPEQRARAKQANEQPPEWNPDTFPAAVVAACVDSDMTEQDWVEFMRNGPAGAGEVSALWRAALQVNDRSPDVRVGNGFRSPS